MPSPYELDLTAAQINTALNNAWDVDISPVLGSGRLVNSDSIYQFVTGLVDVKTGLVYSGATGVLSMTSAYQDLDLSSIVGVNRALVYLEVWDGSVASSVFFREKGSAVQPYNLATWAGWGASGAAVGTVNEGGTVVCFTNALGLLEYRSSATSAVNYRVVAYEVMRIV